MGNGNERVVEFDLLEKWQICIYRLKEECSLFINTEITFRLFVQISSYQL